MANGVIISANNIKTKQFTVGSGSTSLSPTAVSFGHIATLSGVTGLHQDNVLGFQVMQALLSPASNLTFGLYNDFLYIASTQNCTMTGSMTVNMTYIEP